MSHRENVQLLNSNFHGSWFMEKCTMIVLSLALVYLTFRQFCQQAYWFHYRDSILLSTMDLLSHVTYDAYSTDMMVSIGAQVHVSTCPSVWCVQVHVSVSMHLYSLLRMFSPISSNGPGVFPSSRIVYLSVYFLHNGAFLLSSTELYVVQTDCLYPV